MGPPGPVTGFPFTNPTVGVTGKLMINLLAKKSSALGTGVLSTLSDNTKETVFHTATHKISNGILCCLLSSPATMQKRHLKNTKYF
jgi:hypothetical protein